MEFDDLSQTFVVVQNELKKETANLFRYDQIKRFYPVTNSGTRISGDVGRSAIGGVLFGDGGATASAMSNMKVTGSCSKMYIELELVDCYINKAQITFINSATTKGSLTYQKAYTACQAVLEQLERISDMVYQQKKAVREAEFEKRKAIREAELKRQQDERDSELEKRRAIRAAEQAAREAEYDRQIQAIEEDIKKSKERIAQRRARIAEYERQEEERRKRRAEQAKNGEVSDNGSGFSVRVRVREVDSDEKKEDSKTLSAADEILKFKQLLDAGIITEEEFQAKKKQLLGLQ